jgi:hypothetical protein
MFRVAPEAEKAGGRSPIRSRTGFQYKVFKMFLDKGKITKQMIAMLSTWRHSGFHVFCGNRIAPDDETAIEYLGQAAVLQQAGQGIDDNVLHGNVRQGDDARERRTVPTKTFDPRASASTVRRRGIPTLSNPAMS